MYKIGEASKITKISSRMLRYYDKENILKPSHIENNGYRYYTEGDINVISKIKNLRRYEFTYEEIKDIFDNNKYESIDIYINKIEELTKKVNTYGYLISEIEEKVKFKDIIINNYDINICERQSVNTLCQKAIINYKDIGEFIESCYNAISKNKSNKVGYYYVMFYNNENVDENTYEIEYYQPIIDNKDIKGFNNKVIESGTYISTICYGDYENLTGAYSALYKWIKNNDFKIKGNFVEKYFVDSLLTPFSYEFITEVSIKVSKD
ncbi:MerR family transcriptional regulator [Clostridioides difficile]|mgnify:CR=1 FL=1|uniref:MerR family transcriptional regulator n=1 Tax=unclassified Clostridioides TaxID=2635829 RepID=UPI0006BBC192|nr:hypothetical protein KW95_07790 [Clostridioides difficile]MDI0265474.1 MerR family transcriptional regulator [Clostridioides difficile]